MRHKDPKVINRVVEVSIHAPRVGCDIARTSNKVTHTKFQFTHPVWGATPNQMDTVPFLEVFQFTHPVWGATFFYKPNNQIKMFQFTHPVWGATWPELAGKCDKVVSIHAPRVGCDRYGWRRLCRAEVSIHAPRVGCDRRPPQRLHKQPKFQFTHPVWGATRLD